MKATEKSDKNNRVASVHLKLSKAHFDSLKHDLSQNSLNISYNYPYSSACFYLNTKYYTLLSCDGYTTSTLDKAWLILAQIVRCFYCVLDSISPLHCNKQKSKLDDVLGLPRSLFLST